MYNPYIELLHVSNIPRTVTPSSVSFGGSEVNTYDSEAQGWSTQSDRLMTSSYDFNKLQQTNVQNYESLLLSDTNSKSPSRRSAAESKAFDLNHMIQHSLSKLNQVSNLVLDLEVSVSSVIV